MALHKYKALRQNGFLHILWDVSDWGSGDFEIWAKMHRNGTDQWAEVSGNRADIQKILGDMEHLRDMQLTRYFDDLCGLCDIDKQG